MKTFPLLSMFIALMGAIPGHALWTKVAGPDSVRVLSSSNVVIGGDASSYAVVTARKDSVYVLGGYPGQSWNKGISLESGNVTATLATGAECFAGTSTGKIFNFYNCVSGWTRWITLPGDPQIHVLLYDNGFYFAGTSNGVYRLKHWVNAATLLGPETPILSAKSLWVSGARLHAASDSIVFASLDGGTTWSSKGRVQEAAQIRMLVGSDTALYAATDSGVYRSKDSATTWVALNNGLGNRNVYALVNAGADVFAGTGAGVYRSTNSGASWALVDSATFTAPVYSLSGAYNTLYAGTDAGVWRQAFSGLDIPVQRPVGLGAGSALRGSENRLRITSQGRASFVLASSSAVLLKAYTPSGQEVAVLVEGRLSAGSHAWGLPATLPAGLYVYRLKIGGVTEVQKVLITR